uniref:Uncharacterized protein n=1 Tax=Cyanistes caeruleus TaxID=156563 RepID=A0A8C0UJB6_CYACU
IVSNWKNSQADKNKHSAFVPCRRQIYSNYLSLGKCEQKMPTSKVFSLHSFKIISNSLFLKMAYVRSLFQRCMVLVHRLL